MEELANVFAMSPELKGALWLWAVGVATAGARWLIARYVPAGNARAWIDGLDNLLQIALGNSKRLADRAAKPPKHKVVP